jgi:hypothetical protein
MKAEGGKQVSAGFHPSAFILHPSEKAVAGHRTPRRSLTPSNRLFMIASHACQISFNKY